MPQTTVLQARGIYSYPNQLGELPVGALYSANNVVIDRDGIIAPRRGNAVYGTSFGGPSDAAKQLMYYKARLLVHWENNLNFDSDGEGAFVQINETILTGNTNSNNLITGLSSNYQIYPSAVVVGAGIPNGTTVLARSGTTGLILSQAATATATGLTISFTQPIIEQSPGVRLKFQEMNGNFYFTSNEGVQKISSTTNTNVPAAGITPAGAFEALDGEGFLNSTQGWFTQDSSVAYRVVWGLNDANQNLLLGDPSQRIIVSNSQLSLMISNFNQLLYSLDVAASTPPVTLNGNTYSNTTVDTLSSTTGLSVGMTVTGSGIQAGTTITSITSSTALVLSLPATTTLVATPLTFGQTLSYTNFNALALTSESSSIDLYNALQTLSQQLDTNLNEHIYAGLSGAITQITPTYNVTVTGNTDFSSTISNVASVSDIYTGLNVSGTGIPANTTVLSVSSPSAVLETGDLTINTVLVPNISNAASLSVGMSVSGGGILAGTTITALTNAVTSPVVLTGTTHTNLIIDGISSTTGLVVGMSVEGSGIPDGTTITQIFSGTEVLVNQPTIASATVSLSFSNNITLSNPATITAAGTGLVFNNNTITLSNPVGTTATNSSFTFSYPTIVTSPANQLVTGNQITIVGSNSVPVIDTQIPITVTVINSDQFTIPTVVSVAGNTGTWTQSPVAIAQNYTTTPLNPATNAQLVTMQQFYDALVNELNVDTNISEAAREAIGGDFLNSTQSATVNLVFTIPSEVNTGWFYQIYRSDMATSIAQGLFQDQQPDDECKLIVEANPTAQDIDNGFINFFDDVPESFRLNGANLYTNAISGAGILQENSPPPYCQDLTLWMNYMFYGNTSLKHNIELDLLTGINLVGNTFSTSDNGVVTTYTFVNDVSQYTQTTLPAASNFPTSGPADYFDIYNAQNYITYRFYFNIGTVTPPSGVGVTLVPVTVNATDSAAVVAAKLQLAFFTGDQDFLTLLTSNILTIQNINSGITSSPVNNVTASGFSINVTIPGNGEDAILRYVGVPNSATPAQQIDGTARSLVRIINMNPAGGIFASYLSGPTDLPGQILLTSIQTNLIPFYLTASAPIGPVAFNPALPVSGTTVSSTNNAKPNGLYFSKIQEPDAVPQTNFLQIGQEDYPILRLMPLRDSLFVMKEDGVFRLYGTDPSNFTVYLFDSSTKLLAQDTAAILNNQVYMLSNQGVVTVSDTGVSVLSRPVEGNIIPVTTYPNYTSLSFAFAYEGDRSFMLWIQGAATDTEATICYRYNTFTSTWVNWPITKRCGVVIPDTNLMYLGPNDVNNVEQERKSYTRVDQADRQYEQQVPNNAVNGYVLSLGSVFQAQPGDVMIQTQQLTVDQYNRFVNKLSSDPSLQNNYSVELAKIGDNLRGDLTSLAALMDTDTGLDIKTYSSSIAGYGDTFAETQEAFNIIVGLINSDPGARFHNYTPSTYPTELASVVTSINKVKQLITLAESLPFIVGPIFIYKAIDSNIEWAPQHCGDPSMLKKIHEGTFMFENVGFDNATASYSSDLYTAPVPIVFEGDGTDVWGGVIWGQGTWGGQGSFRPFRTYIPVPIQRCRFIQAYFDHNVAMRTYAIFGISYTWEPISSRAYR
jgi:hypothetical protein